MGSVTSYFRKTASGTEDHFIDPAWLDVVCEVYPLYLEDLQNVPDELPPLEPWDEAIARARHIPAEGKEQLQWFRMLEHYTSNDHISELNHSELMRGSHVYQSEVPGLLPDAFSLKDYWMNARRMSGQLDAWRKGETLSVFAVAVAINFLREQRTVGLDMLEQQFNYDDERGLSRFAPPGSETPLEGMLAMEEANRAAERAAMTVIQAYTTLRRENVEDSINNREKAVARYLGRNFVDFGEPSR